MNYSSHFELDFVGRIIVVIITKRRRPGKRANRGPD